MELHNADLAHHASSVESQQAQMLSQMGEYSQRLQQTAMQNEQLQNEIAQLRAFLAVRSHSLCLSFATGWSQCAVVDI